MMKKGFVLKSKTFLFLIVLCFLSTTSFAQKKANFSGTWILNKSESTLGEQFSFAPSKITITQNADQLSYERLANIMGQETTQTSTFTLDGKECTNPGFQETEVKSTATWLDKKTLTIVSTIDMGGGVITITETYTNDGKKKLIVEQKMNSEMGDMAEKWVLDKE